MNIKKTLYDALKETFLHLNYSIDDITLTFSAKEGSDFQCNSAFALAKKTQTSPEVVANAIMSNLKQDIAEVTFAKPGFINFKIINNSISFCLININYSKSNNFFFMVSNY